MHPYRNWVMEQLNVAVGNLQEVMLTYPDRENTINNARKVAAEWAAIFTALEN